MHSETVSLHPTSNGGLTEYDAGTARPCPEEDITYLAKLPASTYIKPIPALQIIRTIIGFGHTEEVIFAKYLFPEAKPIASAAPANTKWVPPITRGL